MIYKKQVVT